MMTNEHKIDILTKRADRLEKENQKLKKQNDDLQKQLIELMTGNVNDDFLLDLREQMIASAKEYQEIVAELNKQKEQHKILVKELQDTVSELKEKIKKK